MRHEGGCGGMECATKVGVGAERGGRREGGLRGKLGGGPYRRWKIYNKFIYFDKLIGGLLSMLNMDYKVIVTSINK